MKLRWSSLPRTKMQMSCRAFNGRKYWHTDSISVWDIISKNCLVIFRDGHVCNEYLTKPAPWKQFQVTGFFIPLFLAVKKSIMTIWTISYSLDWDEAIADFKSYHFFAKQTISRRRKWLSCIQFSYSGCLKLKEGHLLVKSQWNQELQDV